MQSPQDFWDSLMGTKKIETLGDLAGEIRSLMLLNTGSNIAQDAARSYLGNRRSDLEEKMLRLQIVRQKRELGLPMDDDDYEQIINDDGKDQALRNTGLAYVQNQADAMKASKWSAGAKGFVEQVLAGVHDRGIVKGASSIPIIGGTPTHVAANIIRLITRNRFVPPG